MNLLWLAKSQSRIGHLLSLLAICQFAIASEILACPAFVYSYQIPKSKRLTAIKRNQLGLFTMAKDKTWKRQRLQVNRVDRFGNIDFDSLEHGRNLELQRFDRIAFADSDFSEIRWTKGMATPCETEIGYEVQMEKGYGYLFVCHSPLEDLSSLVNYDKATRIVTGDDYQYIHDEHNHLSFTSITIGNSKPETQVEVAKNAEQLIRADVKKFFTMRFGASDVSALLKRDIPGEMGLLGLLQFYLKILFFKIELSLTPEVQFYQNSLYMPMSLHSPVDAKNYLNMGSGIFYSWESPPEVKWDFANARLPVFANKGEFHQDLKKFCHGRRCRFGISGIVKGHSFNIDFGIDRNLVLLNFYPQLMTDFATVNRIFDEEITKKVPNRIGVFFETSSLPKGDHYWDFWIGFGDKSSQCPAQVRLKPLLI